MILIDNYDSFTYNIVQYLRELGENPKVFKNDEITIDELKRIEFDKILISPGFGSPKDAGISLAVISEFWKVKPILGVCLGFQCIVEYFGGQIIKDVEPVHGKVSEIFQIRNSVLFRTLPQRFLATRYHSLIAERSSFPDCLNIIAQTKDNKIMAFEHSKLPIYGVQFHPEAYLSEYGHEIFKNFLDV